MPSLARVRMFSVMAAHGAVAVPTPGLARGRGPSSETVCDPTFRGAVVAVFTRVAQAVSWPARKIGIPDFEAFIGLRSSEAHEGADMISVRVPRATALAAVVMGPVARIVGKARGTL